MLGTDKIMTLDGTGYVDIPAGADLNDAKYRTPGAYKCVDTATAKTLENSPVNMAFLMWTIPSTGRNNFYPSQIIRQYVDGEILQRVWDYETQKWNSDWRKTAQIEPAMRPVLLNGFVGEEYFRRKGVVISKTGNQVAISVGVQNPAGASTKIICIIPKEYRPTDNRPLIGITKTNTPAVMQLILHDSGELYLYGVLPANVTVELSTSYPIGV